MYAHRRFPGRIEPIWGIFTHTQNVQAVSRDEAIRARRRPRASSPHGVADGNDKGPQAGYAGGDDDHVGFQAV